jgi:flagellar biosynthetic protein FliR
MLVMLRMTGMMVFSPILGRRNVPVMLSAGFAFVLAMLLSGTVQPAPDLDLRFIPFVFLVFKELMIGMVAGFILQMFLSVLVVGGEMIDMQLGISMAKAFDPGTNASISITSSIMNAMFVLVFFVTNNHLTFIHMVFQTFTFIPVGTTGISIENFMCIPELFSSILIFAMKLCLPVVVIEVIVTVAVGIIMRIIPQINVFVVNIQFKLLVGIFVLILLVGPFTAYFENLIQICFERVAEVWGMIF